MRASASSSDILGIVGLRVVLVPLRANFALKTIWRGANCADSLSISFPKRRVRIPYTFSAACSDPSCQHSSHARCVDLDLAATTRELATKTNPQMENRGTRSDTNTPDKINRNKDLSGERRR